MPTTPFQPCTESPSYFSEKCSRCRFACLKEASGQSLDDADRSGQRHGLSVVGSGAVIVGAAASVADYPTAAASLTIFGAVVIIAKILRKR